jgi:GMP synthase (glutamine-hydrolysing)
MALRLLVLDGYAAEGRDELREAGGSVASELYERLLRLLSPEARVERAFPADAGSPLPDAAALRGFDGVVWTGSSLTIHREGDPRVARQIELARAVYDAGVPSFGSCWAAQLAVVAAGGRCAANPRGREFGVARRIALDDAGRAHPMFAGKPPVFDALTSHSDEITTLAPGVRTLAANDWSRVQAVSVERGPARFWAVQYHPEYDLHEVASLCRLRAGELVREGRFASLADAERYADDLEALHAEPERDDLRRALDLDASVLDPEVRTREVRNWLASLG